MVKKLAVQAQAPFKKNLKPQWTQNHNLLFIYFNPLQRIGIILVHIVHVK
jgi:hypothetical protein